MFDKNPYRNTAQLYTGAETVFDEERGEVGHRYFIWEKETDRFVTGNFLGTIDQIADLCVKEYKKTMQNHENSSHMWPDSYDLQTCEPQKRPKSKQDNPLRMLGPDETSEFDRFIYEIIRNK